MNFCCQTTWSTMRIIRSRRQDTDPKDCHMLRIESQFMKGSQIILLIKLSSSLRYLYCTEGTCKDGSSSWYFPSFYRWRLLVMVCVRRLPIESSLLFRRQYRRPRCVVLHLLNLVSLQANINLCQFISKSKWVYLQIPKVWHIWQWEDKYQFNNCDSIEQNQKFHRENLAGENYFELSPQLYL